MQTIAFSDARNRLKEVLDRVARDADYTIITRRDAEAAVVMSLDSFNGLMETVHLLGPPEMPPISPAPLPSTDPARPRHAT